MGATPKNPKKSTNPSQYVINTPCPRCKAKVGFVCLTRAGTPAARYHLARSDAAAQAARDREAPPLAAAVIRAPRNRSGHDLTERSGAEPASQELPLAPRVDPEEFRAKKAPEKLPRPAVETLPVQARGSLVAALECIELGKLEEARAFVLGVLGKSPGTKPSHTRYLELLKVPASATPGAVPVEAARGVLMAAWGARLELAKVDGKRLNTKGQQALGAAQAALERMGQHAAKHPALAAMLGAASEEGEAEEVEGGDPGPEPEEDEEAFGETYRYRWADGRRCAAPCPLPRMGARVCEREPGHDGEHAAPVDGEPPLTWRDGDRCNVVHPDDPFVNCVREHGHAGMHMDARNLKDGKGNSWPGAAGAAKKQTEEEPAEHTPGPWEVARPKAPSGEASQYERVQVVDSTGAVLTTANVLKADKEAVAAAVKDGELMAAAPDMKEVLQGMLTLLERAKERPLTPEQCEGAMGDIREVLKQAGVVHG